MSSDWHDVNDPGTWPGAEKPQSDDAIAEEWLRTPSISEQAAEFERTRSEALAQRQNNEKSFSIHSLSWRHVDETKKEQKDARNKDQIHLVCGVDGCSDGANVRFELYSKTAKGDCLQFQDASGTLKDGTAAADLTLDLAKITAEEYTVYFTVSVRGKYSSNCSIAIGKEPLLVKKCEGPQSAEPGSKTVYKVTELNRKATDKEKKEINWCVRVGEHTHKEVKNIGTEFEFAIPATHAGDTISVHPFVKSPADNVKVETTIGPYLLFTGSKLTLFDKEHKRIAEWAGVSGEDGETNPKQTKGPIPEGRWLVKQSDIQNLPGMFSGEPNWEGGEDVWGKQRVQIYPFGTDSFGRKRFYIHGGKKAGSKFGIDLTDKIVSFIEELRKASSNLVLIVDKTVPSKKEPVKIDKDDFNTMVATIYGEAASCSENAWRAVGHVIMNRIGRYEWKSYKTAKDIVTQTGFDAYTQKTPLYLKAFKHLNGETQKDSALIDKMAKVIEPIYNKTEKDFTNDSVLYYSPKAQKELHNKFPDQYKETPKWALSPTISKVNIEELVATDDFAFFKYNHKG